MAQSIINMEEVMALVKKTTTAIETIETAIAGEAAGLREMNEEFKGRNGMIKGVSEGIELEIPKIKAIITCSQQVEADLEKYNRLSLENITVADHEA